MPAAEPLQPEAALADLQVPAGYRVELVASEPQVADPVAIAFGEDGRLWVVEMRDYPALAEGAAPSSHIRILEDRDGDGRFESARTFAEGLLFPTGLQLWGSGAFVTLAGEIAYFPDEDHDGAADGKITWYEGFATLNEQLRANHPTLAVDGWIYVAGGLRGGQIKNHRRRNDTPISINGRDFAFNPKTGECRAVSGNGQFGLTFDEFGRRFTCSNRNPLIEVMIDERYLHRNPKLVLPRLVHDVAAAGDESRIFPRSRALTTSAQHAGQFTAACGVEIFDGDALPPADHGDAFICESTANLVHRERISPGGVAMRATRVEQESEFLTATDEWFRPVNLCNGPDGALYVVDMYRAVIEHPEWMPEELRSRPDMQSGADRGRIYRIVAEGRSTASAARSVHGKRSMAALAATLEHPNGWQRNLAVRLILESSDPPINALQALASKSPSPSARYLALSLLQAHGALETGLVVQACNDPSPAVRERALCLAEHHCDRPEVQAAVLKLARDAHPRVRYQAALSLSFLPADQVVSALKTIAQRDQADEWTCRAVALAARDRAADLLVSLLVSDDKRRHPGRAHMYPHLLRELTDAVVALGGADHIALLLEHVPKIHARNAESLVAATAQSLESRNSNLAAALAMLQKQNAEAHRQVVSIFDDALSVVANTKAVEADRLAAMSVLRVDARPDSAQPLLALVDSAESMELQLAAIDALRVQSGAETAQSLLEMLPDQLPSLRRATIDLLCSKPNWAVALLVAAEADIAIAEEIDPAHRLKLMQHTSAEVRQAAERLFGAAAKNREVVLSQYQEALTLRADADRGRQVFLASCASCHRVGGDGTAVGPDIGDSSMKSSGQLLTDILDPNRAIDANYVSYTALTVDGIAHQGVIQSESDSGIVLLGPDARAVTIPRDELQSLTSGKSLMPEGLEQQISPQQMADLLRFLKTWRHAEDLRRAAVRAAAGS